MRNDPFVVRIQRQITAGLLRRQHQCFPPHYDGHEAVVLQIEGSKDWTIWSRAQIGQQWSGAAIEDLESLSDPIMKPTLNPGDVLYIPRGYPHQARATRGRSLHLTLQLYPPTTKNFRETVLKAAEHLKVALPANLPNDFTDADKRPDLNELLPVGFLDFEGLGAELLEWFDPDSLATLLEHTKRAMLHGLCHQGQPAVLGYFGFENRVADINSTTVLRKRSMSLCTTGVTPVHSWLKFHATTVKATPGILPTFQYIVDTECFRLADLPGSQPDNAKREVVIQLVRLGLLAIEDSG